MYTFVLFQNNKIYSYYVLVHCCVLIIVMRCLNFGVKNLLVIPSNPSTLFFRSSINVSYISAFVNSFIILFSKDCFLLMWLIKKHSVACITKEILENRSYLLLYWMEWGREFVERSLHMRETGKCFELNRLVKFRFVTFEFFKLL